ncbi:nucleotide exchange factor GrpE [Catellatospora sp. NPDC049111]|uniref:nucleotide exchange factor GrpE n=1 Tax=Catellatospora sp. NPDC049111 TaxID=3155271 RepID=UPI0033D791B7
MTEVPQQTAVPADERPSPPEALDDESQQADAPAEPTAVDAALAGVRAELAAVREGLAAEHDRAAARERVIDRLHEENQRLRGGELRLALRPVLTELQRLRNDLRRQAVSLPATLTAQGAAELLDSFAYSVELTLERSDVQVVRAEVGDPFDPARHRAAGVVAADDPAQDGTVAQVLADGYHDLSVNRTTAHAVVTVYRWTPPTEPGQA